jgi:hypothetical protein
MIAHTHVATPMLLNVPQLGDFWIKVMNLFARGAAMDPGA